MSTHPVKDARAEIRPVHSDGDEEDRSWLQTLLHEGGSASLRRAQPGKRSSAVINDERGQPVFEQHGIEVPTTWSQTATNIVASKYFRGALGLAAARAQREAAHLARGRHHPRLGRAAGLLRDPGRPPELLSDELTHLLVQQKAAFNSPVWFNVGIEKHPQASACFINSVNDTMESILGLAKTEGMLFKFGSGTGSNLSEHPLLARSRWPAAAPPRGRSPSCAATTPSRA